MPETGEPEMVDVYSIGNYEEDRSSNEAMFYLRSLANYKFYIEVKGPRGSYFPVPIPSMQDFIQNADPSNTSTPAPVTNPNGWISQYYEPPALSFYENNKSQIKKSLILSKDSLIIFSQFFKINSNSSCFSIRKVFLSI